MPSRFSCLCAPSPLLLPPPPQRCSDPQLCFSPTSAPWGGEPPSTAPPWRTPAMLPAFLLPTSATKAPSPHSTSYHGAFFSLPTPLHTALCPQPHLPPALGTCTCGGTAGFLAPQSPDPTRHRGKRSRAGALQRHPGRGRCTRGVGRGGSAAEEKGVPVRCCLVFLTSGEGHTPVPG